MIIKGNRKLKELYHKLGPEDIFIGSVISKHLKQSMLIDLLERGVHCFPSPLSQVINSSKTMQALVFKDRMLPHTKVITRRVELLDSINLYNQFGIGHVVTKEDHMHCGYGVRRWETVESLYSYIALLESSYPFILQPFLENFTDVRVIIVGDHVEAYARYNPHNFRMNISSGGTSSSYVLDKDKEAFCRSIMNRGKFPFAHIDLHILENGKSFLSEIALNGGIKGAAISRKELDKKKQILLKRLAEGIKAKGRSEGKR
jgi:ribosomal protein S6--L-glutamate ligase